MPTYAITINRETCAGDKVCTEEAPNTLSIDEEGKCVVVDPEGDPPDRILSAAKKCPFGGITLHDADTGEQVYPEEQTKEPSRLSRLGDVVRWRALDLPISLKDGTEVRIRPMTEDDEDASYAFFCALPQEDREYLRADVTRRDVIARRITTMKSGKVKRLVAVVDEEIVADGAIELSGDKQTSHVGELRLIVARPYQRKGLGMLMARELYALAAGEKVEEIVARTAEPQTAARNILRKLGFREEAVLPGHVPTRGRAAYEVIQMRCDLESLWNQLETFIEEWDWQRSR